MKINKVAKNQLLYDLFPEVGTKWTIEEVQRVTGIKSVPSLRVTLSQLKRLPNELRISVGFAGGYLVRTE